MIFATRSLKITGGEKDADVLINIYAPERARVDWVCRYEISWPEGMAERQAAGIDAVQAVIHALQMIGAELYTSTQHKAGRLEWLAPGRGYGFPVANNIHDLLVGDDKKFL